MPSMILCNTLRVQIHRELNSMNLLVGEDDRIKITGSFVTARPKARMPPELSLVLAQGRGRVSHAS